MRKSVVITFISDNSESPCVLRAKEVPKNWFGAVTVLLLKDPINGNY
jgi:hypothetical protein